MLVVFVAWCYNTFAIGQSFVILFYNILSIYLSNHHILFPYASKRLYSQIYISEAGRVPSESVAWIYGMVSHLF
jgi:hypothetical protein